MLSEFRPDVVIGVGGYASGPAMLAAVLKRIPTLAFEPNVVPGFANRMVARLVSAAAVHFAETAKYFRRCRSHGRARAAGIFRDCQQAPRRRTPTLLVFGGSQGAHAINQAVMQSVAQLAQRIPGIHIIHQTGERDYNDAQAAYANMGDQSKYYRFIDDMPAFFARADLLIVPLRSEHRGGDGGGG